MQRHWLRDAFGNLQRIRLSDHLHRPREAPVPGEGYPDRYVYLESLEESQRDDYPDRPGPRPPNHYGQARLQHARSTGLQRHRSSIDEPGDTLTSQVLTSPSNIG